MAKSDDILIQVADLLKKQYDTALKSLDNIKAIAEAVKRTANSTVAPIDVAKAGVAGAVAGNVSSGGGGRTAMPVSDKMKAVWSMTPQQKDILMRSQLKHNINSLSQKREENYNPKESKPDLSGMELPNRDKNSRLSNLLAGFGWSSENKNSATERMALKDATDRSAPGFSNTLIGGIIYGAYETAKNIVAPGHGTAGSGEGFDFFNQKLAEGQENMRSLWTFASQWLSTGAELGIGTAKWQNTSVADGARNN